VIRAPFGSIKIQTRWSQKPCGAEKRGFRIKEEIMDNAGERVIDLIFGRWRSQILGFFA
jgi:hypothetical protein